MNDGKRRIKSFHDQHQHKHSHDKFHREFKTVHRYIRFFRPISIVLNILIIYLLFQWIGAKTIGIFFISIFMIKDIVQIYMLSKIEKKILKPIEKLKVGVAQISSGNYEVRIENNIPSEIGSLIADFNNMAQKLEDSERTKTQYEENRKDLIVNISHDLKTPITSITGYVEAILEGVVDSPDKTKKYLQVIHSNISYINNLIDDLFLFSKLDMQKIDFNFEKVQINSYLNDVMEEFKFDLVEKEVKFDYIDSLPETTKVNMDGKRIYQVIRNIIDNAVRYGPEVGLNIEVLVLKDKEFAVINIKDNGPGIEEEKVKNIFDRFYRIDNERTKNLASTGLGLAIAKELVESHGGVISVSSVINEGSCFTIKLPIINEENI
jgi:signal transduction histidine kinase